MAKLSATLVIVCVSAFSGLVMAQQVGEGVEKIVTSPAEVPKGMAENADSDAPVLSTTGGAVKGGAKAAGDIVEGSGDIVQGTVKALTGGGN